MSLPHSGLDFQTTSEQLQRVFSAGINSADLFRENCKKYAWL